MKITLSIILGALTPVIGLILHLHLHLHFHLHLICTP